jgi:hypothetical protein
MPGVIFMKKNNFFMVILFGVIVLSGISFEARGMENKALIVSAGVSAVALATTLVLIKNTATYQTYSQHKARQLAEKDKSDNPFLDAQPLSVTGLQVEEKPVNDRIADFQKQYDQQRNAYNQQTHKNDYWGKSRIIDSYEPDKK